MQQVFTKDEYRKYVDKISPNSKTARNASRAYVVGGLICVIGQFFLNSFRQMGLDQDISASLTSVVMVFWGDLYCAGSV